MHSANGRLGAVCQSQYHVRTMLAPSRSRYLIFDPLDTFEAFRPLLFSIPCDRRLQIAWLEIAGRLDPPREILYKETPLDFGIKGERSNSLVVTSCIHA